MNWNWSQLKTIIWLRWRLTRNQWAKSGGLGPVISIIAAVAGIIFGIAAGIGGIIGGAFGMARATPEVMLIVWDVLAGGFLFIWMIGVMAEIQRSETIDLARLLHLPVSLEGIFAINYLASHVTIGIVLFVPAALGLSLGLVWSKGWLMLLLIPLVLAFVFMITAWTYCLRGWLVSLMVNPRRRKNVIVGMTLAIVLTAQMPNLYFNIYLRNHNRHRPPAAPSTQDGKSITIPPEWLLAHNYVPPLWLPKGAIELSLGNVWPALWGALGAFLLGVAGLAKAYQSTIRFYQGQEKAGSAKTVVKAKSGGIRKTILLERELPLIPEEVAALALGFFRSMSRAPEIRMSLIANIIVLVVLAGVIFTGHAPKPNAIAELFVGTGAVAFTFFGLLQIVFNQFGFDRDAFRAIILLPASRSHVLMGKNLALAPIVMGLGVPLLILMVFVAHLPLLALIAAVFQLASMFLFLNIAGNLLSMFVPYRISAGSLKPTKPPPKTVILMLLSHMLFPVIMAPIFIPPALGFGLNLWLQWPAAFIDAVFSLILLIVAALAYWASLPGLGRLLEKKEQAILLVVSQEVE